MKAKTRLDERTWSFLVGRREGRREGTGTGRGGHNLGKGLEEAGAWFVTGAVYRLQPSCLAIS